MKIKKKRASDNSDVNAKTWYAEKLVRDGYTIIANTPVDIVAEKDGVRHYFEVKSQNKTIGKSVYDGMVKLEQLECALENEGHFSFVFLRKGPIENGKHVYYEKEMTLDELLSHLSGNWRIEHNFHFNLKNPTTSHFEIKPGSRTDINVVKKEVISLIKIQKKNNDRT